MKKRIFVFLILGLVLLTLVSAETSFFVKKNTNYSINFICKLGGNVCPGGTNCNLSIRYPNSSYMISDSLTINVGNSKFEYNITQSQTSTSGEYSSVIECANTASNGTFSFIYEVNPSGIRTSQERTATITRSIYFIFGIAILLFLVFLFGKFPPPVRYTLLIFSLVFILIGINILLIGMQDEVVNPKLETFFSGFTVISWYFYWFAAGLLVIMWLFSIIQTILYNKNMQNLKKYGLA